MEEQRSRLAFKHVINNQVKSAKSAVTACNDRMCANGQSVQTTVQVIYSCQAVIQDTIALLVPGIKRNPACSTKLPIKTSKNTPNLGSTGTTSHVFRDKRMTLARRIIKKHWRTNTGGPIAPPVCQTKVSDILRNHNNYWTLHKISIPDSTKCKHFILPHARENMTKVNTSEIPCSQFNVPIGIYIYATKYVRYDNKYYDE